MKRRRRQVGIPGGLPVVMGMQVDKSWREQGATAFHNKAGGRGSSVQDGDATVPHTHRRLARGRTRTVYKSDVTENNVESQRLLLSPS